MGLLDALFNSDSYGGQGGGLLDFLRNAQMQNSQYQPSPGFPDNQPSPLDNARWPAGPVGAPQPGAGRTFDSALFNPATYAPNQAQPIAVGSNYQMPRMGSADQFTPQAPQPQTAQAPSTDISAQSRAPQQQQPQELPPAFGGTSYLERLNSGGGLIGSMLGDTTQQKNLTAQYHAIRQTLQANGDTPQAAASKAMIAVMNPEAAKTILPELFTNKHELKMVKDGFGGEKPMVWDAINHTLTEPTKPEGGAATSGMPFGMQATTDAITKAREGGATKDQLLQILPTTYREGVNALIKGEALPTNLSARGEARNNHLALAHAIDPTFDESLIPERRKYRTELGSNSANTAGGQGKAFVQGLMHAASLASTLEKLDNSNGLGIPLLAKGMNTARQGFSNEQSAIADEAAGLGQTLAGEVGKLFSGAAGGGVHERELTRERFDTVRSKPQLAAALRATLETMDGGLKALESRRDAILGPNSGVEFADRSTKENIAKIQASIDRLEGKSSGNKNATGLPSGWSVKVR